MTHWKLRNCVLIIFKLPFYIIFTRSLGEQMKCLFYLVAMGVTGIPDHLTCLLRNLYAGQEATVRTGHETVDWFQIGKRVHQGCILSPWLTYMQHISCRMPGWIKHKLEWRLQGEISITSDMQMIPPLWQKVKNPKNLLMKVKEQSEKNWLKTQYSEN